MLISSEENDPHQILLTRVFYDCFKLIYAYLKEGDKVRESYSCLQMMISCWFFHSIISKRASLKRFYLHMKLLQSSTVFKQKNNHEVSCD